MFQTTLFFHFYTDHSLRFSQPSSTRHSTFDFWFTVLLYVDISSTHHYPDLVNCMSSVSFEYIFKLFDSFVFSWFVSSITSSRPAIIMIDMDKRVLFSKVYLMCVDNVPITGDIIHFTPKLHQYSSNAKLSLVKP